MNNFIAYSLELLIASSLLYLGYLFIRNKLAPNANRFLLLTVLIVPLMLPLVNYSIDNEVIPQPIQIDYVIENVQPKSEIAPITVDNEASIASTTNSSKNDETLGFSSYFVWGYLMVSAFFLLKLCYSLLQILKLKRSSEGHSINSGYRVVDTDQFIAASFFHLIFIGKEYLDSGSFDQIIEHERIHSKKLHSIDILICELLTILFWFNPIYWLMKKEIKTNHEFEADQIVSNGVGRINYSKFLVGLAVAPHQTPMNLLAALGIKRRINRVLKNERKSLRHLLLILPFLVVSCWMVSCETTPELAGLNSGSPLNGIQSITTTYYSHQNDTQHKDGKTIAIANFLPNGELDNVTQYLSYPYNLDYEREMFFLGTPTSSGLTHIMDGLDIGPAKNIILYGNDWPKLYAKRAAEQHLLFKDDEYRKYSSKVTVHDSGLPQSITTTEEYEMSMLYKNQLGKTPSVHRYTLHEKFQYNEDSLLISTDDKFTNGGIYATGKVSNFEYTNDSKISKVYNGEWTHKLSYKDGKLAKIEYLKGEKVYHFREFFYNEDGLKERTEMINIDGEPEYTITYDYKFYD